MRPVVIVLYGCMDIFDKGGMTRDVMMIKKPVFELLVGSFDHRVGKYDVALGDDMANSGMLGRTNKIFGLPGILGTIVGNQLTIELG